MESQYNIPTTYEEAIMYAVDMQERAENLEETVKTVIDKSNALDELASTEETYSLRTAFKALGLPDMKSRRNLVSKKVLYRGRFNKLMPYSTYQHKGYFVVDLRTDDGSAHVQTKVTAAGIAWMALNKRKLFNA